MIIEHLNITQYLQGKEADDQQLHRDCLKPASCG